LFGDRNPESTQVFVTRAKLDQEATRVHTTTRVSHTPKLEPLAQTTAARKTQLARSRSGARGSRSHWPIAYFL
jgi:hypothetical protein